MPASLFAGSPALALRRRAERRLRSADADENGSTAPVGGTRASLPSESPRHGATSGASSTTRTAADATPLVIDTPVGSSTTTSTVANATPLVIDRLGGSSSATVSTEANAAPLVIEPRTGASSTTTRTYANATPLVIEPQRLLDEFAQDYERHLQRHYPGSDAAPVRRARAASQSDELDSLVTRLHGLRLLLSLAQQQQLQPAATLTADSSALRPLMASPAPLVRTVEFASSAARGLHFLLLLSMPPEPPPPPPGVPVEQLEELMPRLPYFRAKAEGDPRRDAPTECSVCLDTLEPEAMVRVLRCGHLYHQRCIDRWFAHSTLCPCCKQSVC